MISTIPFGGSIPSNPGYPEIAPYIREVLNAVYYDTQEPKAALDDAATKSAIALGWKLQLRYSGFLCF